MTTENEKMQEAWGLLEAIRDNVNSALYAAPEMIFFWLNEIRNNATIEESGPSLVQDALHLTNDPVNHPSHYTAGRIECIDFLEDQQLGYHAGNVVKYVVRHAHKGNPLQDLQKARWYLDRLITQLESAGNA